MTEEARYFKCLSCGQPVQGWNASQDIDCCESKNMVETEDTQSDEVLWSANVEKLYKLCQYESR